MVGEKIKCPVSGSCVDENALLMSEVRGEWADWLEMIESNSNSNNHSLQPRYAEYHLWTHNTSNQMGSSSRRQHRLPHLSAKNRTRRLQFAQAHQNWTIEDWENVAWSDESRFLLWHSDGRESENKTSQKTQRYIRQTRRGRYSLRQRHWFENRLLTADWTRHLFSKAFVKNSIPHL